MKLKIEAKDIQWDDRFSYLSCYLLCENFNSDTWWGEKILV